MRQALQAWSDEQALLAKHLNTADDAGTIREFFVFEVCGHTASVVSRRSQISTMGEGRSDGFGSSMQAFLDFAVV